MSEKSRLIQKDFFRLSYKSDPLNKKRRCGVHEFKGIQKSENGKAKSMEANNSQIKLKKIVWRPIMAKA